MYVKGKGLWSHLDDVSKAPTEKTALDAWETKDAQIITCCALFQLLKKCGII
jgi:hypothetical protein